VVRAVLQAQVDQLQGMIDTEGVTWSDVLVALGILGATLGVAWLLGRFIERRLGRPGGQSQQIIKLVSRTARWLVIFVGAAWALSLVGLSVTWLALIIGVLLVIAVLFARPLFESLAAGFVLSSRHGFNVGDQIRVDDLDGEILEITTRSTVLRLRDGRRAHLPNKGLVDKTVVVYTTEQRRRTAVDVAIDARADIDTAERVILDALAEDDVIAKDPAPRVRARGFARGVQQLSVRFWHASDLGSGTTAQDHAVRRIKRALGDAGIDLATPDHDGPPDE
jgi:small-conductance mechanosensitive channel